VTLCIGYAYLRGTEVRAQTETAPPLDQSLPTPTPLPADAVSAPPFDSPLPTPTPVLSPEAEVALQSVAEQAGIPRDQLTFGSEEQVTFPLLGRSYIYVTVHYDSIDGFKLFSVLVDPATRAVEPDYNAVRAAEEAAYRAKYGKLDPALYDRLQQVDDEALLPVVVWVAHTSEERSQEAIVAEVVARYPAAGEALAQKGVLWAVDDPKMAVEIQEAYEQLLFENVAVCVQPVEGWLKGQGFAVEDLAGMPALAATLPKSIIVALSQRGDVGQLILTEAEVTPASNIAIPTDRTPIVWARGYNGSSIRLAILEHYNINAAADNCLDIVRVRASTVDPVGHKSTVAAIAACNDTMKLGMAPGVQIVDAGHNGLVGDAVTGLTWATDPLSMQRAYVVNESESVETDTTLHLLDRAYDYWVKIRGFTAVIAAGNTAGNVTTPGKAYNVITVGNLNDQDTVSWADDDMWWESGYTNPNTGVEKPEVAAPGTNIQTVAAAGLWTGTSFAAPQVAGLAAILMQRHTDLKFYPTTVKAIIMASAVHNIEGSVRLSSFDGAGAIDAALADWIAQTEGTIGTCNVPCWWNIPTTDSFPSNGGNVQRTFNASRGEHIRVVIS
ncbi:MAG TPA: S8 family serine peptidase, partial [Caldilineaceae bacterium]|nr:S8 family serine peptidase [Caldilineaceae bacterium]